MFKKYKPISLICSLSQQIFIEATTVSGAILDAKLFLIFFISLVQQLISQNAS